MHVTSLPSLSATVLVRICEIGYYSSNYTLFVFTMTTRCSLFSMVQRTWRTNAKLSSRQQCGCTQACHNSHIAGKQMKRRGVLGGDRLTSPVGVGGRRRRRHVHWSRYSLQRDTASSSKFPVPPTKPIRPDRQIGA